MYDSVAYDPVKTKQLQSTEFNNMIGLFFRSFLLFRQSVFTRYGVTSGIGVLLPNPFDFHEIATLHASDCDSGYDCVASENQFRESRFCSLLFVIAACGSQVIQTLYIRS